MIYAIRAGRTPYIKFGVTTGVSVGKRLEALQTGCPLELRVVATCDGGKNTESFIHSMLKKANAHHRGEWFKLCQDVETILEMMRSGQIKIAEKEHAIDPAPEHKRLGACLKYAERTAARLGGPKWKERSARNKSDCLIPSGAA